MKEFTNIVLEMLEQKPDIELDEIVDAALPFCDIEPETAVRNEVKNKVRQIIGRQKGSDGVRDYYGYTTADGKSVYINGNRSRNIKGFTTSIAVMKGKVRGMEKSIAKATRLKYLAENQMVMEAVFGDGKEESNETKGVNHVEDNRH